VRRFIIVIMLEVKIVLSRQQKRVFKRKIIKALSRLEVINRPISDLKVNPKIRGYIVPDRYGSM
jgi:hypothetical protein